MATKYYQRNTCVMFLFLLIGLQRVDETEAAQKCIGGTYFDKHLGRRGRNVCCSELCDIRAYQMECQSKCPNYHKDKERDQAPEKADVVGQVMDPPSHHDPPKVILAVVIPAVSVAVVVIVLVAYLVARRRACRRGPGGALGLEAGNENSTAIEEVPMSSQEEPREGNPLLDYVPPPPPPPPPPQQQRQTASTCKFPVEVSRDQR